MVDIESVKYPNQLQIHIQAPTFERTDSLFRGFVVRLKESLSMQELGEVMDCCKRLIPGWDIEFAPKRYSVFQWKGVSGEMCVIRCMDVDLPHIIDNKPAWQYPQDNLLRNDKKETSLFIREDIGFMEMEKLIALSKAFHEMGFETLDWIYLSDVFEHVNKKHRNA
eukprot:765857-Hanusia_phi.AAC.4